MANGLILPSLWSCRQSTELGVARCLTNKMLTYATGRELEAADRGEVDFIMKRLAQKENRLRDLVKLVVESKIFLNK